MKIRTKLSLSAVTHLLRQRQMLKATAINNERRIQAVLNISQKQTTTVQALLNYALDEVVKLTESRFGYIYFYDETSQEFILHAWSRDVMEACSIPNPPTRYQLASTGIWGEVVRQRKPIVSNHFAAPDPLKKGYPEGHAHLSRVLSIPVFIEEKIVAVVGVANKQTDYNDGDISQLILLMDAVWSVVQRKQADETVMQLNQSLEQRVAERTSELDAMTESLRQSELKYRIVADNTHDWEFWLDPEGRFVYTSPSCQRITGHDTASFYADPSMLLKIVHPDDQQMFISHRHGLKLDGEVESLQFRIVHTDGSTRWIDHICKPIFDDSGQFLGTRGSNRDRTELKQAQLKLEQLNHNLTIRTEQAESANKAKSEFLANMSHELRTPMNAITGMSYLALQTDLNPRQQDYVDKISSSAQILSGIINDILDFSKIESGKMEVETTDFQLDSILNNLTDMVSVKASEKGLGVYLQIAPQVPLDLQGDPLRLGQILLNLVSNAVKFTDKGDVVISIELLSNESGQVMLQFMVEDSGIGITPEQLSLLFKPFTQADGSTTRRYGGTGLGLIITKHLVELMGGQIYIESTLGVGSTCYATLPFGIQPNARTAAQKPPRELRELKILQVDDSAVARLHFKHSMAGAAPNFMITTAASGEDALELLQLSGVDFDVIMLDWNLPGINGLETARRIKLSLQGRQLPKLFIVTSHDLDVVAREAKTLELDGFLVKPLNAARIIDAITTTGHNAPVTPRHHRAIGPVPVFSEARVLLVEDNRINQQVARELITQTGIAVEVADNGRLAVEALNADPDFDLIFMDLQMPEMDGYTATKQIRQQYSAEQLPIIAMTAHAMSEERKRCLNAGMNDHLAKPVDPQMLYATLIKWLTQKQSISTSLSVEPSVKTVETDACMPAELPGITMAVTIARFMGNSQLMGDLIIAFNDQNRTTVADICRAVEQHDIEQAKELVHGLKGVAANIGAEALAESARILEEQLREHEMEALPACLHALTGKMDQVFEAARLIAAARATATPPPRQPTASLDAEQLAAALHELADLLRLNKLEARRKFAAVKPQLAHLPELKQLDEHLCRLDFKGALTVLNELTQTITTPPTEQP